MAQRKARSNCSRRNRSRRNRNNRSRRNRLMMGGMAPIDDASMLQGQKASLAQGTQFLDIHKAQHGGSVGQYPASVMSSTLPSSMIPSARTGPLDTAIASIQGMQDGGRRHRRSNRRSRSNRKSSRRNRRNRKHGGGLSGSPLSANSMLLPSGMEKQAALNYEWSMAKDPSAFAPNP